VFGSLFASIQLKDLSCSPFTVVRLLGEKFTVREIHGLSVDPRFPRVVQPSLFGSI
jgi:hypothetical protein